MAEISLNCSPSHVDEDTVLPRQNADSQDFNGVTNVVKTILTTDVTN